MAGPNSPKSPVHSTIVPPTWPVTPISKALPVSKKLVEPSTSSTTQPNTFTTSTPKLEMVVKDKKQSPGTPIITKGFLRLECESFVWNMLGDYRLNKGLPGFRPKTGKSILVPHSSTLIIMSGTPKNSGTDGNSAPPNGNKQHIPKSDPPNYPSFPTDIIFGKKSTSMTAICNDDQGPITDPSSPPSPASSCPSWMEVDSDGTIPGTPPGPGTPIPSKGKYDRK
ncbi:unnamed protein product, partial [Mesorhabditis spiculigera]